MKSLSTFILMCALTACAQQNTEEHSASNEKKYRDLATDQQVLEALNKEKNEDYEKRDLCIQRSDQFKDLILIGYFANDRGCMDLEAFWNGNYIKNPVDHTKEILNKAGWEQHDQRKKIALHYIKEVLTAWEPTLSDYSSECKEDSSTFHGPIVQNRGHKIIVSCWVQEPVGMTAEKNYYKLQVTFTPDGSIASQKIIDRATIE